MLFYVLVYALATMGTFAALAYLGSARRDVNDVDELSGLARSQPLIAGALAVCMFSLAGLPPLAGFWGKLTLFGSAIQLAISAPSGLAFWFTVLAVVGAVNAAIAAAYYLRIVAVMYFQPAAEPVAASGGPTARLGRDRSVPGSWLRVGAWPGRVLDMAVQSEAAARPQTRTVQADAERRGSACEKQAAGRRRRGCCLPTGKLNEADYNRRRPLRFVFVRSKFSCLVRLLLAALSRDCWMKRRIPCTRSMQNDKSCLPVERWATGWASNQISSSAGAATTMRPAAMMTWPRPARRSARRQRHLRAA